MVFKPLLPFLINIPALIDASTVVSTLVRPLLQFKHLILSPNAPLKIALLIQRVNFLNKSLIKTVRTREYCTLTDCLVKVYVYINLKCLSRNILCPFK